MRVVAEVYDAGGYRSGPPITAAKSVSVSEQLDGAGSVSLDLAMDERALDNLVNEAETRIRVQRYDGDPMLEWGRCVIRDNELTDEEGGTRLSVSGPDTMDLLTEETVGLGRSYTNNTLSDIINDLVSLRGWTASIDTSVASALQTARYDGVNVLQALIRTVQEKGCHFRNGLTPNSIEVGVFGDNAVDPFGATVRAIRPPSIISRELQENTAVILIDRISRSSKSNDVVNWCIPLGAGEGSAAMTLKDATYVIYDEVTGVNVGGSTVPKYPIYRRLNAYGIYEYYINASGSARPRKACVNFKEIGPVANDLLAKQLAANALVEAAIAYLDRQKVPLICYKISAKNVQASIRPGDKIRVRYKGEVEIVDETRATRRRLTYINVNEDMWVMKVSRKISDSGIDTDFEVSTIDRYAMDSTRIVVSMMQAMQARNMSVQTFPFGFQDSSERVIQGAASSGDAQYKPAIFSLQIPDIFTDVIKVQLRVVTRPLYSMTDVGPDNFYGTSTHALDYSFAVYPAANYPSDITLTIDGVDRTTELGGPWNPSGGNSAVNTTLDITQYIVNASGGLYQDHSLVFAAGYKTGEVKVNSSHNSQTANSSSGIVEAKILFMGTARGVIPAPV